MNNQIEKKIRNNVYNYYGKIKKGLKSNFIISLKEKRNSSGFSRLTNKKYKTWIENLEKIKNNNKKNTNFLETVKVIDKHVKKKYKKKGCESSTKKVCKKYNKILKASNVLIDNKKKIKKSNVNKIINVKIKGAKEIIKNGLPELNFKRDFTVIESIRTFIIYNPLKRVFFRSSGTSNPGNNFPNTFFPCFPEGKRSTKKQLQDLKYNKNLGKYNKYINKCKPKGKWLSKFFEIFNYKIKFHSDYMNHKYELIISEEHKNENIQRIKQKDGTVKWIYPNKWYEDDKFEKYLSFLTKFCNWTDVQLSLSLGGAIWNSEGNNGNNKIKIYNDYTNNPNNPNNPRRFDYSKFDFRELKEFVRNHNFINGEFRKRTHPINDISKKNNDTNIRSNFNPLKGERRR